MDTFGWALTIGGAVLAGVILLFIEYGCFQKKKKNENNSISETGAIEGLIQNQITERNKEDANQQSWPDVINVAVNGLSKIHPRVPIEITRIRISDNSASVYV